MFFRVRETTKTLEESYNNRDFDVILIPTSFHKPLSEKYLESLSPAIGDKIERTKTAYENFLLDVGLGSSLPDLGKAIGSREVQIDLNNNGCYLWFVTTHVNPNDNIEYSALKYFLEKKFEDKRVTFGISKNVKGDWNVIMDILKCSSFDIVVTDSDQETVWSHPQLEEEN